MQAYNGVFGRHFDCSQASIPVTSSVTPTATATAIPTETCTPTLTPTATPTQYPITPVPWTPDWTPGPTPTQTPHNCSFRGLSTFTPQSHVFAISYGEYAGFGGAYSATLVYEPGSLGYADWVVFAGGEFGAGISPGAPISVGYSETEATIEEFSGLSFGGTIGVIYFANASITLDGQCNVTRGNSVSASGEISLAVSGAQQTFITSDLDSALDSLNLNDTLVETLIRDTLNIIPD